MRQPDRGAENEDARKCTGTPQDARTRAPARNRIHCAKNGPVCTGNASLPSEIGPSRERSASRTRICPEPIHNASLYMWHSPPSRMTRTRSRRIASLLRQPGTALG
jgi:hypothetical protein